MCKITQVKMMLDVTSFQTLNINTLEDNYVGTCDSCIQTKSDTEFILPYGCRIIPSYLQI